MSPRTVAVAPFRNAGGDKYPHIGKALEAMLIDDLSLLQGVRVLDREHVNALIEEARLGGLDLVGEDAAARAGALLVAGGHVDESPTHLSLEAMLVDVDTGAIIASARTEALATEFYNLVPNVAGQFASALGQPLETLPPDVQQKIEQPHTKSLKAVLLFGEALDALDRKDVNAAVKARKAIEKEDADFLLVNSAVSAGFTASTKKYALLGALALLVIGGGAGGYMASRGGDSGGPPNPAPPPGGNNPPSLQGVGDRSVQAEDTAEIDMQCFDSDSTVTTIQSTSAAPNSSFNQTSGNPGSGRYRQVTNANQAGQVFNVAFVCTDNGNPPASDTKTARITVLVRSTDASSPTPTATPSSTPTRKPTTIYKPSSPSPPSTNQSSSPTPTSPTETRSPTR